MTKRTILSLAIKVLGVLLVIVILPTIPRALNNTLIPGGGIDLSWEFLFSVAVVWGQPFLALVIGLALIWASNLLSLMLIPDMENEPLEVKSTISKREVLAIILFGIGVWFTVYSFGALVRDVLSVPVTSQPVGYYMRNAGPNYWAPIVGSGLQFVLGLLLILRPYKLAHWIERYETREEIDLTMPPESKDGELGEEGEE